MLPTELDQMVGRQWQLARGQASAAQRGFEEGPYISLLFLTFQML
jgi:hypothetical protein